MFLIVDVVLLLFCWCSCLLSRTASGPFSPIRAPLVLLFTWRLGLCARLNLIISERDVKGSVTEFCLPYLTSSSHHFSLWFLLVFLRVLRHRHLRRFQADTPQWTGSCGEFRKGHGSSGRWREVRAVYRNRKRQEKKKKELAPFPSRVLGGV